MLALSELINQAVGDAISGILLVEAALRRRQWGLAEWAALYTDLPSRQTKVCLLCCAAPYPWHCSLGQHLHLHAV